MSIAIEKLTPNQTTELLYQLVTDYYEKNIDYAFYLDPHEKATPEQAADILAGKKPNDVFANKKLKMIAAMLNNPNSLMHPNKVLDVLFETYQLPSNTYYDTSYMYTQIMDTLLNYDFTEHAKRLVSNISATYISQ